MAFQPRQGLGEMAGPCFCGGPAATCLTLLRCARFFVDLKWYKMMAGGNSDSMVFPVSPNGSDVMEESMV